MFLMVLTSCHSNFDILVKSATRSEVNSDYPNSFCSINFSTRTLQHGVNYIKIQNSSSACHVTYAPHKSRVCRMLYSMHFFPRNLTLRLCNNPGKLLTKYEHQTQRGLRLQGYFFKPKIIISIDVLLFLVRYFL
jgi:hypothetical protein